jgi:small conductance mechanosensitive channel
MVLGEVEKITLRTVYIRHGVGPLETVPFSSITRVVNRSQSYNYAVITCGVPHGSDLKCVYQALRDTSDELLKETDLTIRPLEPVVIRGISEVTDTMIRIAASIKTTQDPKNFFEREFNYRLKKNLDRLGIHQPAVRNVIEILSPLSPESIPSVLPPNKS